jgi:hypothetical protein
MVRGDNEVAVSQVGIEGIGADRYPHPRVSPGVGSVTDGDFLRIPPACGISESGGQERGDSTGKEIAQRPATADVSTSEITRQLVEATAFPGIFVHQRFLSWS